MRWIYLSPHLDDAVFSAGGLIYEQARAGTRTEIWTFMCGYAPDEDISPLAQILHAQWGFTSAEETTRLRRLEDQEAAAVLGANILHFDFLDCIYRRTAPGEWLYSEVFVPPHLEDAGLPAQIAETITARLESDDVLVCPLGLGGHADHRLVRQGAELSGYPLQYVPDVPYIFYHREDLPQMASGMQKTLHPIGEAGLHRWQEAALKYKSQLVGLGDAFDTPEKVRESLRSYLVEQGGLPLLQVRTAVPGSLVMPEKP